jgi:hypothetical protein
MHNLVSCGGTQRLKFPDGVFQSVRSSKCSRPLNANLDSRGGMSLRCVSGFLGRYRSWDEGEEGQKEYRQGNSFAQGI